MTTGSETLDNLLAKAQRSFEVAEGLLEDNHADFAASRAYYGCFYTAEALLLSKGLSYSRHSQVVAQFGHRQREHLADVLAAELVLRHQRLEPLPGRRGRANGRTVTVATGANSGMHTPWDAAL